MNRTSPPLRLIELRDGLAVFETKLHEAAEERDAMVPKPEYAHSLRIVVRVADGWITEYSERNSTTLDTNGSTGSRSIVNVDIAVRYL